MIMPIFEFTCNQCDTTFETLVLGSDTPECPSCHGKDLKKLMSACGFVSKTTGPGNTIQTRTPASSSSCSGCSATSCSTCASG